MRLRVLSLALFFSAACAPDSALPALTPTLQPAPSPTAVIVTLTPRPTRTASPTPHPRTPTPTIPADTIVERGELPPGFSLTVYAEAPRPTSLSFGPDGRLYVASTNQVVYAFADADGDGRAEERRVYARGVPLPLGLLWVDEALYISYNEGGDGRVAYVLDTNGDGVGERLHPVLTQLPAGGRHQNDGLALGADGYVYLGMGSSCDVCREPDWRSASILRFKPDGSALSVFASGLRNPYDLAFNAAGDLFATDNGRDDLGPDAPPEELNHIRPGGDYGWPTCWEGNGDPACAKKSGAAAVFTPRSSANGLAFYTGDNFPPGYQDNAFVAVLGSYVYTELERGVQRIVLTQTGDTYSGEAEWFLKLREGEGRPLDVTVGPEGGLYVADYDQSLIYRIVYGAP